MIPYGRHKIDEQDIQAVVSVLKGDWLTNGPMTSKFEKLLAEITQSKYAVACTNGTAALHLAMRSFDIKQGDKVIVPAISFLATANAARFVGADVIFADVDPNTGLMSPETLETTLHKHKNDHIKAIVNVHLNGQCENLEVLHGIAKKHGLYLIDDAAHALGTCYVDKLGNLSPIGSNQYSDITIFSFHPVKTIAAGEGGALTINSAKLAEKLLLLRNHGMTKDQAIISDEPWHYDMHEIGYNYRMSDIHASLALSQLKKIQHFVDVRRKLSNRYDNAFKSLKHIRPLSRKIFSQTAWHLYVLLINFEALGKSRGKMMNELAQHGISTQVHYRPISQQPYYENLYGVNALAGAQAYYDRCLSIPLYVGLTNAEQETIIDYFIKHEQ